MEFTTTPDHKESQVLTVFSITIFRGREVIDREQLPFNAFTGVEAHNFAQKIAEAHGRVPLDVRFSVIREDIPAT